MANEDKDKFVTKSNEAAGPTSEQLLKMLLEQNKQSAESNRLLAEAILESRKPYVDPKVLEQREQARKDRAMEVKILLRDKQLKKQNCPHIRDNGTPNIKWMEHSNGITKGVCGGCFSEFDTRDPQDLQLLRRDLKSIRNMGRAGQHTYTHVSGRA